MKFIFYTDVQLSGQTPRHRVDDYQQALIAKLEEIYRVAKSERVDFLVCGGDLFNSHRIFSFHRVLSPIMDIMCDSGLNTYLVIGQHDILGYNATTYKSSTLAFVVDRCENLEVIWDPVRVGDIALHSSHVWEDPKEAANKHLDASAFNVLVAHHLLTNKQTVFDTVNTGEFAQWMRDGGAEYDMVLSGDLHDGYDTHEHDGMWFCNPGSVARQAISDIKRMPRYAVIEAESNNIPIIDVRDIKCAQSGDDVFGETAAEVMRSTGNFDPTAFVKEVEDFEVESADIHELVQKVGLAKNIPKPVLDYIASKSAKLV
jgi:DNA repair exonuclease SbcCD nuclease subunit